MIDLGTLTGLHDHRHELAAYCLRCDRLGTLPLVDLVADGQGSRRLPITVRDVAC